MSIFRATAMVFSCAVLAACTQTPIPFGDQTRQPVITGVTQWQNIANQAASDVVDCLEGVWVDKLIDGVKVKVLVYEASCKAYAPNLAGKPIYVDRLGGATLFARNMRDMMTTQLIIRGRTVTDNPEGALTVSFRVYPVPREGTIPIKSVPGLVTAATSLAALGLNRDGYSNTVWESGLLLFGAGLIADMWLSGNKTAGDQIVMTMALQDGRKNVMRRMGGYYIDQKDLAHYFDNSPPAEIGVANSAGTKPPKSRSFNVVSE